jgi:hypothetical protein
MAAAMSLLGFSLSRTASASEDCVVSLTNSFFEIDAVDQDGDPETTQDLQNDANLVVDNAADGCIDWLTGGTGTDFRDNVEAKFDQASGQQDDSFGQGTAENNPNPTIVKGSIPPEKSDLKAFGVFEEEDETVNLFWTRVQEPNGTTNMDFELNQLQCTPNTANPSSDPDCAENGTRKNPNHVTPKRTGDSLTNSNPDDVLISYDLSKGGDVPTISIRFWNGTQWAGEQVISDPNNPAAADAAGSINVSPIAEDDAGTIDGNPLGPLTPFTFGEASVSFDVLFGSAPCGEFGSAYLKSRSSDSFTAEVKDFIEPEPVDVGNCPAGITTDASNNAGQNEPPAQLPNGTIQDSANLDVPDGTDGNIVFKLYGPFTTAPDGPEDCIARGTGENLVEGAGSTVTVTNHNVTGAGNTKNPYTSTAYTPTAAGIYQWTAQFNSTTTGVDSTAEFGCGVAAEQSVVATAQSTISTTQSWVPNDSATLNHGGPAGYAVTFTLFKNVSQADCLIPPAGGYPAGSIIYGPDARPVSGSEPFTASSNNSTAVTAVTADADGDTYRWKVVAPATTTHNAVTSCVEATAFSSLNNGDTVSSP